MEKTHAEGHLLDADGVSVFVLSHLNADDRPYELELVRYTAGNDPARFELVSGGLIRADAVRRIATGKRL
jgi:hypothetical protein